jgi:hypothetical protein
MRVPRPLVLAAALALLISIPAMASASPGGNKILDTQLAGLPQSMVKTQLFGVEAGGLPWRLDSGSAKLYADGRLEVAVHGLVLASGAAEGTNPIPHAQAIVTCAGEPMAWSSVVPYSAAGDALINERVTLPAHCLAPTVFFAGVPAPGTDLWFAVTGW